jgi:hypothetical protein
MFASAAIWLNIWTFYNPFAFLLPDYLHAYAPGIPLKELRQKEVEVLRNQEDLRFKILNPDKELLAVWLCFEAKRPNRLFKLILDFKDERRVPHWTGVYWGKPNLTSGPYQYEWTASNHVATHMRGAVENQYIIIAFKLQE